MRAPSAWPEPRDGFDDDVVGEEAGALGREAEAGQDAGQILGEGLRGRVALARLRIERRLADAGARLEAGVPDVVRLERPLQPGADQRRDARPDGRLEHRAQQLLDLGRRNLALDLELAIDEGGEVGRGAVDLALRVEQALPARVADVRLARRCWRSWRRPAAARRP